MTSGSQSQSSFDEDLVSNVGVIIFLKFERIACATGYLLLFLLTVLNIWQYIIKQGMYKSIPMVCCYTSLFIMSGLSFCNEIYMTLRCGQHDCIDEIIYAVSNDTDKEEYFTPIPGVLQTEVILLKLRQQLLWCFGVFQCVMILTLALRMRQINLINEANKVLTCQLRSKLQKIGRII